MNERDLFTAAALGSLWSDGRASVETEDKDRDGNATLWLQVSGEHYSFTVEVKRQVNVATATHLAERVMKEMNSFLLVTEHVQSAAAQALQDRGVNYVDAAGNCHVERPPLFLHVEGRKRKWV